MIAFVTSVKKGDARIDAALVVERSARHVRVTARGTQAEEETLVEKPGARLHVSGERNGDARGRREPAALGARETSRLRGDATPLLRRPGRNERTSPPPANTSSPPERETNDGTRIRTLFGLS